MALLSLRLAVGPPSSVSSSSSVVRLAPALVRESLELLADASALSLLVAALGVWAVLAPFVSDAFALFDTPSSSAEVLALVASLALSSGVRTSTRPSSASSVSADPVSVSTSGSLSSPTSSVAPATSVLIPVVWTTSSLPLCSAISTRSSPVPVVSPSAPRLRAPLLGRKIANNTSAGSAMAMSIARMRPARSSLSCSLS